MDPSFVLHKTDKGINELKTREYRLSPILRTVLILVDGKTDVSGLCKKVLALTQMEESLSTLLKEGFVSAGNDVISGTTVDSDSPATRAKWEIVEMIGEVLGEEVAHRATKRFTEIPDTTGALKQAINECRQFIELTIDVSKAKTVETKGLEILAKIKQ